MEADLPGRGPHRAWAPCGRGSALTRGWDPPLPLVGPPSQPQVPLWLIFNIKIRVILWNFSTTFILELIRN